MENKFDYNTEENVLKVIQFDSEYHKLYKLKNIVIFYYDTWKLMKLSLFTPDEFRCLEEREQALKTSNESGIPIFVPVCKENGQYVDIQCHQGTGYCWCVNVDGKPVPRSSTKYSKPNCINTGKPLISKLSR